MKHSLEVVPMFTFEHLSNLLHEITFA